MTENARITTKPSGHRLPLGSPLVVQVHQTEAEVETLKSFWTNVQSHPNSHLEHYLLVCRLIPELVSPIVLSLWKEGECRAILAGRLERARFQPKLGYLKLLPFQGLALTFIHQGAIGEIGVAEAQVIVEWANDFLAERKADVVVFNLLPESSPLPASISASGTRALGVNHPRWSQHWELSLQTEPGFLIKAMRAKHRSWIRRKERNLEAAFPGRLAWKWHSQIENVTDLCLQMESVAVHTYQRGVGAGFIDDKAHRERLALFAREGALRILVLELDGHSKAFWIGMVMRGEFHSSATGFVPELAEHEVGTQMFLRLVDELVKEGLTRFDFGLGDAHYKKRFGDRSWREFTVRLFSGNIRGRVLRMYLGSCETVDRLLRALAQRLTMLDRIKQAWRKRLTAGFSAKTVSAPAGNGEND